MFQKIKNWVYKKCTKNKKISLSEAKNTLLKITNKHIVSIYSYPKYETETLVLIMHNTEDILTTLHTPKIKNILQNIPFICLSKDEVHNASDVFSLQFFDIKTTAILLFGEDVFKNITISNAHLRRKMEFDIRNKSIYLREESIHIPADILIHNILPELTPVLNAGKFLHIPLETHALHTIETITSHLKKKTQQYSQKEIETAILSISTLLEKWTEAVEQYEKTL